ncbi:diacylglycerol kinase [Coralloluteibacterium stylophorae]|uniref:Diacylglycerol kinase n=1 Tax=Coralloluteibacterium stylophorae TaxID=1776034 RepID=A0A8J7VRS9_9GAMM|nr:diacylglycerol kinase [Coralloluteibacterium stylophorae]MBS7456112.1 diacylglycerol kinase [Coralloluteibacterium stylophorae]
MRDGRASNVPRGPRGVLRAARWSLRGLAAAWRYEASFRLEVCVAAVLLPLGVWLGQSPVERVLLTGTVLLVLTVELLNSAIETVIERFDPGFHVLAGRAKDLASAAVFAAMLNVAACWLLLLLPRWLGT